MNALDEFSACFGLGFRVDFVSSPHDFAQIFAATLKDSVELLDLARINPGWFFGELGVIREQRRSAFVFAETTAQCYVIAKEDFLKLPNLSYARAYANKFYPDIKVTLDNVHAQQRWELFKGRMLARVNPTFENSLAEREYQLNEAHVQPKQTLAANNDPIRKLGYDPSALSERKHHYSGNGIKLYRERPLRLNPLQPLTKYTPSMAKRYQQYESENKKKRAANRLKQAQAQTARTGQMPSSYMHTLFMNQLHNGSLHNEGSSQTARDFVDKGSLPTISSSGNGTESDYATYNNKHNFTDGTN